MFEYVLGIIASVIGAVLVAAVKKFSKNFSDFIVEQREHNKLSNEFQQSMQRAEINRYFRIVVEKGEPISTEEMTHLSKCYEAYHNSGGNDVGTLMYDRIKEHVILVTTAETKSRESEK